MISLLRQRNFSLLWFGGLISMIGDWMLYIALPIYVYQLSGSTLATSATFIAKTVPRLLLGSVAGTFVDRWDRKRTMIISNILLALSLLPLLLVRSTDWLWLVYGVAFLQSTINEFFGPAENALLPRVVKEEELISANSLNSLNNNLARVIGPSVGGLVAALFSLAGIVLIDALTFIVAASLIASVTVSGKVEQKTDQDEVALWQSWWEGLRFIWREPVITILFVVVLLTGLGEGVFSVMFIVWVNKVFGGGALELGWFMTAQGVGGIVGGFIIGSIASKLPPARLLGLGSLMFGVLDLMLFNYPNFSPGIWLGLGLIFLVGLPAVGFGASWNTLLQQNVPDSHLGRVFGVYSTLSGLLFLVGTSLAGVVGSSVGPITMLNIQGGAYVVAGLFVLVAFYALSTRSLWLQNRVANES
jgi:MFS family permease